MEPNVSLARDAEKQRGSTRLLVVDDHPLMRAGIRNLLAAEGDLHVVAEATDGLQAVNLTRELAVDVVIMDLSLPQLGGAEATKQIFAEAPATRILILSMHEETGIARMMLGAGAVGYALKRRAGDELVRAVRVVASGGTYLDPQLASALVPNGASSQNKAGGVLAVSLSSRESEVIRLVARGHSFKEMADKLGISQRTLETYKARAEAKLELHSRTDLIRCAMRLGWLRDM